MFGDVWLCNTVSVEWKRIEVGGSCPLPREMGTGCMISPSQMLIFGGRVTGGQVLSDSAILDLESCSWKSQKQHLGMERCAHAACTVPWKALPQVWTAS
jgi:hypothetical protein